MSQTPNRPLNIANEPTADQLETIQFAFTMPGKPPKRICAKKGDLMLEVMKWPRPWDFNFHQSVFNSSSRGGSFVEIGANIGTTTIFAADFFHKCYVFEPFSPNVAILRRNLELNQIANVEVFTLALSNAAGTARLHLDTAGNSGGHSLSQAQVGPSAQFEDVTVTTLDQALSDVTDATLIQIDTEGFDFKVLQGSREFVRRQKQKPVIIVEFSPQALVKSGSSIGELISFVDEFKYSMMYPAHLNPSPISRTAITDLFYSWQNASGWFDLYLLP